MLIGDCKVKRICLGILLSFFGFSLGAGHFFIQNKSDKEQSVTVLLVATSSRFKLKSKSKIEYTVQPKEKLTIVTKYSNFHGTAFKKGCPRAVHINQFNRCLTLE